MLDSVSLASTSAPLGPAATHLAATASIGSVLPDRRSSHSSSNPDISALERSTTMAPPSNQHTAPNIRHELARQHSHVQLSLSAVAPPSNPAPHYTSVAPPNYGVYSHAALWPHTSVQPRAGMSSLGSMPGAVHPGQSVNLHSASGYTHCSIPSQNLVSLSQSSATSFQPQLQSQAVSTLAATGSTSTARLEPPEVPSMQAASASHSAGKKQSRLLAKDQQATPEAVQCLMALPFKDKLGEGTWTTVRASAYLADQPWVGNCKPTLVGRGTHQLKFRCDCYFHVPEDASVARPCNHPMLGDAAAKLAASSRKGCPGGQPYAVQTIFSEGYHHCPLSVVLCLTLRSAFMAGRVVNMPCGMQSCTHCKYAL